MRTSTKIWLLLAIISNIMLLYFFRPMVDALKYSTDGVYFEFTIESYIGIGAFILANIAGTICFIRFLRTQPLSRQIFFSTVAPTVTFVALMLFFFTITTMDQTDIVTAVRAGLSINTATSRYIWMAVISAVYVVYLYVTYTSLSKPLRRIEKATEKLKEGMLIKNIKPAGCYQFQNIQYDLNKINENYKESEKVIKKIDKNVLDSAIEEVAPKIQPKVAPLMVVTTPEKKKKK